MELGKHGKETCFQFFKFISKRNIEESCYKKIILFTLHCLQGHRGVSYFYIDCISSRSHFQIRFEISEDETIKESLLTNIKTFSYA